MFSVCMVYKHSTLPSAALSCVWHIIVTWHHRSCRIKGHLCSVHMETQDYFSTPYVELIVRERAFNSQPLPFLWISAVRHPCKCCLWSHVMKLYLNITRGFLCTFPPCLVFNYSGFDPVSYFEIPPRKQCIYIYQLWLQQHDCMRNGDVCSELIYSPRIVRH